MTHAKWLRLNFYRSDRCIIDGILFTRPRATVFGQTDPFPLDVDNVTGLKGMPLIDYDGEQYLLRVTHAMEVRLMIGDRYFTSHGKDSKLLRINYPPSIGGIMTVPLEWVARGSVTFGNMKLLFQFVPSISLPKPSQWDRLLDRLFGPRQRADRSLA